MAKLKPMIAVMHYVPANTLFNDDALLPYGYWAWSYLDRKDAKPEVGDPFFNYPSFVIQKRWDWLEAMSYHDCLRDMIDETETQDALYIREKNGNLRQISRFEVIPSGFDYFNISQQRAGT